MAAINKSIYEKFVIESADGSRSVDISSGVIAFTYFENIFSPTLTASAIVVNTGNTIKGENGQMQTVFNGLPIRGGERVLIKIAGNSKVNKDALLCQCVNGVSMEIPSLKFICYFIAMLCEGVCL